MSFTKGFQSACEKEFQRLAVAEKWAKINLSSRAKAFESGRKDRLLGLPCGSADGAYVDGWCSVPNPSQK